jgi:ADP-heptose:LPS heptosyltransferase
MQGEGVGKHHFQFSIFKSQFIRLQFLRILGLLARPFVRRPSATIVAVLYIKPDHLGDLLLATPVLAALRRRLPAARITALVGPWSEVVLQRNPDVDVLLTCPFPGFERRSKIEDRGSEIAVLDPRSSILNRCLSLAWPYLVLLRYALLLRAGSYDLAIIGRDDHWWGAALALLAGVPWRVGFAVPECRPFLTSALPWDPRDHVTAQGLALVESVASSPSSVFPDHQPPTDSPQFSIFNAQFAARFDPAPYDIIWADAWLHRQGIAMGDRLVVLHPGTGGPAKLWFPERWAAVADALVEAGARLALTGGPGEESLVEAVAARMSVRPLTLAGQTTVGQLAALLRRAVLVLGVDSGPLHLAAAQGVPTVHLYGPGDAQRFGPWGDPARHAIVRADLWCSPCGVFGACPRGLARPECMEAIVVSRVAQRAQRLLDEDRR